MLNMARQLVQDDGFLVGMRYVIMDRDPLFTGQVQACFNSIGCRPKVLPPHSPNLNAYIERFIGTVRREIGRHVLPLSTEILTRSLREHVAYYNHERNHQALPIHRAPVPIHGRPLNAHGPIVCCSRLGKTLNYYYRDAA